jgi:hypothetical protein
MLQRGLLVPGRRGPLRAPSRWRSTLCSQTEGLIAQTRARPLRSIRQGGIQRCTIRRMGARACGSTRKRSGRAPTEPASTQSRRPACFGNEIGGPNETSTWAASPYVRWASLGNIQGRPGQPGSPGLSWPPRPWVGHKESQETRIGFVDPDGFCAPVSMLSIRLTVADKDPRITVVLEARERQPLPDTGSQLRRGRRVAHGQRQLRAVAGASPVLATKPLPSSSQWLVLRTNRRYLDLDTSWILRGGRGTQAAIQCYIDRDVAHEGF